MDLTRIGRAAVDATPAGVRARLSQVGVLHRLKGTRLMDVQREEPGFYERSQRRWRAARPDVGLTFGVALSGRPFARKLAEHGTPTTSTRLFEVGPGYGRLLGGIVAEGLPFATYCGLDTSSENVEYLRARFSDKRVELRQGDATATEIEPFDLGFSSLTLKHIYPSFAPLLRNIAAAMDDRARFVFDLIEGTNAILERDGVTFIRSYRRAEVEEIAGSVGLRVICFDQVEHAPEHRRLLVVAGR